MATLQQKLFKKWAEESYQELEKIMPKKDMMHDAYVTVYLIKRPVVPTPERFLSLMKDAYHRHILNEVNHAMHFPLPDALFWLYLEDNATCSVLSDGRTNQTPSRSISDLSAYSLRQLFGFVKKHFPQDSYDIFKMAVVQQMSYSDIAKATGKKRSDVRVIIDAIEHTIRNCCKPIKENSNNN